MRKKESFLFLLILFLLGLFVSKGTNPPLGYVFYKWLFSNFGFAVALRNSYEKFGLVFLVPYSIFYAAGINFLFEKIKIKKKWILITGILILTNGILVWPLWTGKVFPDYAWVRVPKYYSEANEFINKNIGDYRILMLPLIPDHGLRYHWEYRGDDPTRFMFDKVAISKNIKSKYYRDKYNELRSIIKSGANFETLLDEMNVRYLVLRNDVEWKAIGSISPSRTREALVKNPHIVFINKIGKLEIYEYVNGEFSIFKVEGVEVPKVSYVKKGPTEYIVNIVDAREPFNLIFKETYNEFWEAKIGGVSVNNHFLVYNYANAWEIDKKGNYQISVIYKVWPWE